MPVQLPSGIDAQFPAAIVQVAAAMGGGTDPLELATSLYNESQIQPAIKNSIGCVGINQFCGATAASVGIADLDKYRQLPASVQLTEFVAPWWEELVREHHVPLPVTARDIEWLNFLPATYVPGAPDSHVVTSNPEYVSANKGFDHGDKGYITAGDIAQSMIEARSENPARWKAIATAIAGAQQDEASLASPALVSTALFMGVIGIGAAAYFYPAQSIRVWRRAQKTSVDFWEKLQGLT